MKDKDSTRRWAILCILLGAFLALIPLPFTEGYHPKLGILGNIQRMYVEILRPHRTPDFVLLEPGQGSALPFLEKLILDTEGNTKAIILFPKYFSGWQVQEVVRAAISEGTVDEFIVQTHRRAESLAGEIIERLAKWKEQPSEKPLQLRVLLWGFRRDDPIPSREKVVARILSRSLPVRLQFARWEVRQAVQVPYRFVFALSLASIFVGLAMLVLPWSKQKAASSSTRPSREEPEE